MSGMRVSYGLGQGAGGWYFIISPMTGKAATECGSWAHLSDDSWHGLTGPVDLLAQQGCHWRAVFLSILGPRRGLMSVSGLPAACWAHPVLRAQLLILLCGLLVPLSPASMMEERPRVQRLA